MLFKGLVSLGSTSSVIITYDSLANFFFFDVITFLIGGVAKITQHKRFIAVA
jgi:hypothetical protein